MFIGPREDYHEVACKLGSSAQQSARASVASDGDNMHLMSYVNKALGKCEVHRAFDEAPRAPIVGTSTV